MSKPQWTPIALTNDQLNSYRAICDQATTGPWVMKTRTWKPNSVGLARFGDKMEPTTHFTVITGWIHGQLEDYMPIVREAASPFFERQNWAELLPQDAAFIAAARTGWPKTLDAYERKENALNIVCAILRGHQQWFAKNELHGKASLVETILDIVKELTTIVEGYEPTEAINRFLSGPGGGDHDSAAPGTPARPADSDAAGATAQAVGLALDGQLEAFCQAVCPYCRPTSIYLPAVTQENVYWYHHPKLVVGGRMASPCLAEILRRTDYLRRHTSEAYDGQA